MLQGLVRGLQIHYVNTVEVRQTPRMPTARPQSPSTRSNKKRIRDATSWSPSSSIWCRSPIKVGQNVLELEG